MSQREYLSHDDFVAHHGAATDDVVAVHQFAAQFGLSVTETDPAKRSVRLSGTPAQLEKAFGTVLRPQREVGTTGKREFHAPASPVAIPAGLQDAIVGVYGLDNRPVARPRFAGPLAPPLAAPTNAPGRTSYDPPDVAKLYNYPAPSVVDGTGVTIGIIELGGTVSDDDLTAYFARLGLPKPTVKHVSVDGAVATSSDADVEVALDVEIIGAMAPNVTIVIYDAPNTEQGFIDAVLAAAHDQVNNPSVVSISWGAPEAYWTRSGMKAMDAAFAAGSALGVTYCAASGDNGATDGLADGRYHADHPSSSPHVIACGGTTLLGRRGQITTEIAWGHNMKAHGATGGGVSEYFGPQAFQTDNGIDPRSENVDHKRGRGVPDIAGVADPVTGYNIRSNGVDMVVGGTSGVSPSTTALLALTIAANGGKRLGWFNPLLYGLPAAAFNDVRYGDNGGPTDAGYQAGPGWDAVTGLGSPNGMNLIGLTVNGVPLTGPRAGGPDVSDAPVAGPGAPAAPAPAEPGFARPLTGPTLAAPRPGRARSARRASGHDGLG